MKFLLPLTAILMASTLHLRAQSETTTTTTRSESESGDYSILKICQSEYTLKTEDGADAGRIEYVVVDPAGGRIVSAVLSGGVLADRFVAVPFTEVHLGQSHEVVLTRINREHLVCGAENLRPLRCL
jgi:hypothetical protein